MKTLAIFVASLFLFPSYSQTIAQEDPTTEPVPAPDLAPAPTPVIHLDGEIDDSMEIIVAQQLKEINETKATSATVLIDSPGGSVMSMLKIIDDFRQSSVPLMCLDTGLAASAAAVILFSKGCKVNGMLSTSLLMVHQAATSVQGREAEFNSATAALRAVNKVLVKIICSKSGLSESFVERKIANGQEWWPTAKEALALHLVDIVVD